MAPQSSFRVRVRQIVAGPGLRSTFVEVMTKIFAENSRAALLLGDIGGFGFRDLLQKEPKRAFNLGILEQAMVGVGAGMALKGFIPTLHTIAPFLVERPLEQIKIDFGYQKLAGNFVSVGASFDYSKLGATHHCPADIGILSLLPGMKLFVPGHAREFESGYLSNWASGNLNYFRLSEIQNTESHLVEFGTSKRILEGSSGVVLVVGPMLDRVLEAEPGLDLEVHYINSIDPKGEITIQSQFPSGKVAIVEPYYSGSILNVCYRQLTERKCSVLQIGVPKEFVHDYGGVDELFQATELDAAGLRVKMQRFFHESPN